MRTFVAFALLGLALGAQLQSDEAEWKERPVSKVINMLKEMQAELQNEAELDEEAYDKMTCYCETNDKEKTKAIADENARIEALTNSIAELTAKEATLTREVEELNKEIAENEAGLAKSTDIRKTEKAEFVADEKNMIVSITGLKSAVTVLGKHHDAALPQEKMTSLIQTLSKSLNKKDFDKVLATHKQRRVITSFLQMGASQAPSAGSYAPQSGAIFGVLKQMKEQFEGNLAGATDEENTAETEFQNMKAAKTEEIAASRNKVTNKEQEIGDTAEKNAADQQDKADTEAALAADTEFLANLKAQCASLDKEYEERTKTRTEEIAAVADTIGILTDDDAHDQFSKSLGFVQVKSQHKSTAQKVAQTLRAAALKVSDSRLSRVAEFVQLNPFKMVKDKVEQMIADLEAEAKQEVKDRDQCTADLHQNGVDTEAKYAEKDDLTTSIDNLSNTVATLKSDIDALTAEIEESKVDMKRASEDREIENKDFQETIADQRASQAILAKALARLEVFYAEKSFLQAKKQGLATEQNPGTFATYKKNENSGGVMGMIQGVIDESKALENEAIAAEQDSQTAYEQFITDSNKAITAKAKDVSSKTAEMGTQDAALTTAKGDMKANLADLESLNGINKALHDTCDFLMKNYDTRVQAREMEIEALSQSVAMLSGAK